MLPFLLTVAFTILTGAVVWALLQILHYVLESRRGAFLYNAGLALACAYAAGRGLIGVLL